MRRSLSLRTLQNRNVKFTSDRRSSRNSSHIEAPNLRLILVSPNSSLRTSVIDECIQCSLLTISLLLHVSFDCLQVHCLDCFRFWEYIITSLSIYKWSSHFIIMNISAFKWILFILRTRKESNRRSFMIRFRSFTSFDSS
jgi:hypothetical protein